MESNHRKPVFCDKIKQMLLKDYKYLTVIVAFLFLLGFGACKNDTVKKPNNNLPPPITAGVNPNLEKLNSKIEANPNDPTLYAERANTYYENEGYDEAIADLMKAISIDSMQVGFYHQLADVLLDYKKSRLALNTLKKAATLFPKRIPTLLKKSEFEIILRQHDDAFQTLAGILKIDPQNAEAFFMMGMAFKDTGDDNRAINSFQTAVENDPDLIDGWIELGYLFDKKENPIAVKYYDNALRVDSTNILALESKGNHFAYKGKLDEAIQLYKKISQVDPKYANAYYNIGLMQLEQNKIKEAYNHFNIAVNTDPLLIMAYFYRGKASELQGNISSARNDYQQVLNMKPNLERAKEALANLEKLK